MAKNVEVKAKVEDSTALRARIEALSDAEVEVLDQEDTFFHTPRGRLKLRTFPDGRGELIAYVRPDEAGPSPSDYSILRTENPTGIKSFLSDVLGVRGVVRKRRFLYRIGQTRVHLDEVDGLGTFLELEVVLDDGQSNEDGERIASEISALLDMSDESRIGSAYIDLLENAEE